MSHTPGPWEITTAPQWYSVSEVKGERRTICRLIDREGQLPIEYQEAEANARLIAAAPELLEIVKAWETWRENGMLKGNRPIAEVCQHAIAHVEGRP